MNEQTRFNMIEQQIRPWDVLDETVLTLYRKTAREDFVAESSLRTLAYADVALPLGHGQHMLEPKLEARMLQALAPQSNERVLHVGCGSGFFAALLAQMAKEVITMDIIPELAESAATRLAPYTNTKVLSGDGAHGVDKNEYGMFDAVVLTGGTPLIAPEFWNIIKDGGRFLAVIGDAPAMTLTLFNKRSAEVLLHRDILETHLAPLENAPGTSRFSF